MGKRISRQATSDDFTTSTTIQNAVYAPGEVAIPHNIVITSGDAVKKHLKALDTAVSTLKKGFLSIGFNLYWFKDTLAYQGIDGKEYPTIEAFAKDRYDISRSTCLAYIAVVEKFGKVNPETNEIDAIQDAYKDYTPTALITMCAMDSETLSKCKPNMKVKDLKALMTAKDEDEDSDEKDGGNGGSKTSSGGDSDEEDGGNGGGKTSDGDSINSDDSRVNGICLLHINTVEELENKKEYAIEIMKRILTQNTSKNYTVGVLQIEPPTIAGQQ